MPPSPSLPAVSMRLQVSFLLFCFLPTFPHSTVQEGAVQVRQAGNASVDLSQPASCVWSCPLRLWEGAQPGSFQERLQQWAGGPKF